MTMMTNGSIGIDISKDFSDAHRLSDGGTACFPNAPAGFRALSKWLGEDIPARVIFEATGLNTNPRYMTGRMSAPAADALIPRTCSEGLLPARCHDRVFIDMVGWDSR